VASLDADDNDGLISGINVTPLVDVVLVLLVVLMVTATYLAARSLPVDLPKGQTGEPTTVVLSITIDREGRTYVDGNPADTATLRARIAEHQRRDPDVRALIAADASSRHGSVVRVVDLLRQNGVRRFAINVDPAELEASSAR
jgi:biopolymer transport protein ExbD